MVYKSTPPYEHPLTFYHLHKHMTSVEQKLPKHTERHAQCATTPVNRKSTRISTACEQYVTRQLTKRYIYLSTKDIHGHDAVGRALRESATLELSSPRMKTQHRDINISGRPKSFHRDLTQNSPLESPLHSTATYTNKSNHQKKAPMIYSTPG